MIKVSVVIPVYKTEPFLCDCIDSILNQSLTQWELILINDGSPDNSEAICQKYQKQDSRIKYLYQDNAGVSSARNNGLSIASGEYVFFMDSDDQVDDHFLENAYNNAVQNNAEIVVLGKYFEKFLPLPPALPVMALFFKRSLWQAHSNILFPNGIQPCEDGLFSHQLLAVAQKISFEEKAVYFYRQHPGQNHQIQDKQCEKILYDIPKWFDILTHFYNAYQLWHSEALHLSRFLEHEPFELRFCSMPFNFEQKQKLMFLIQQYFNQYVAHHITQRDFKKLSLAFQLFLKAKDVEDFNKALKKMTFRKNVRLFFNQFIPFKKIRRKLKNDIYKHYSFLGKA